MNITGSLWKPIIERVEYKASNSRTYEFIDYLEKLKIMRVWEIKEEGKDKTYNYQALKITDFNVEDLKAFEIWDMLSEEDKNLVQNGINNVTVEKRIVKHRAVSEAYVGIPREFICKACGGTKTIAPALALKRSKAKGITIEEFSNKFQCNECNPTKKGKPANPKYAGIAKKFKCSHEGCNNFCEQHQSATIKNAELVGKTCQEYISSWLCKEHRPKKVHHFTQKKLDREARGENKVVEAIEKKEKRKINSKYEGLPKGYTCCVCGFFQATHPSLVIKVAESKGISVESMYKTWKCKKHRKENKGE